MTYFLISVVCAATKSINQKGTKSKQILVLKDVIEE